MTMRDRLRQQMEAAAVRTAKLPKWMTRQKGSVPMTKRDPTAEEETLMMQGFRATTKTRPATTYLEEQYPERLKRAVRDGCNAVDAPPACDYPDCSCTQTPNIVRMAIASWEAIPVGEIGEKS